MSIIEKVKEALVGLLSCLDPKEPLGTPLFNAIARITVTPAVEVIPWRIIRGEVTILLRKRKSDESDSGLYHSPCTAIRCDEDIENDTIPRLARGELGGNCSFSSIQFVGNLNNPREARGHFFTPVYTAQVEGEPQNGEWWPVSALPSNEEAVLDHLLRLWPMAISAITRQANC